MAGYCREVRPGVYRLEYQMNNQKYSKNISAKNQSEAKKQLALFVSDVENQKFVKKSSISFTEFAQVWIDEYARPNLAKNTVDFYMVMLNSKILNEIGSVHLNKIDKILLTSFYNKLKTEYNLSTKTIKNYNGCISVMLSTAVEWNYLSFNPCQHIKLPKNTKNLNKANFLTPSELNIFIKYLDKEKDIYFKTIIYLILYSGLRRSEALGLKWKDFNYAEGYIHVNQVKIYSAGQIIIKETKNLSSNRNVQLPKKILDMINVLPKTGDFIFNFHPKTLSDKFAKFIDDHQCIPKIGIHKLRHSHATLLLSNNVDIKSISARLGHSETSTTLNIYSHMLSENDKKIANLLDDF